MRKLLPILLTLLLPLTAMSQGKLYNKYSSRQDLKVAEIAGFKLNDSVRVDVVMLQADNDEAWQQMKKEHGIKSTEGFESWLGELDTPSKRTKWNGRPVMRVIASHTHRTIGFYRLDNEAQYDALIDYQINKMSSKKDKKR